MIKPNNGKYRYYVGVPGYGYDFVNNEKVVHYDYVEVFPINTDKFKIQYKRNNGQIFFRRYLNGEVILINGNDCVDYSLIKLLESGRVPSGKRKIEKQTKLYFRIDKKCNGVWSEFWVGNWNIYNCEFDSDNCKISIKNIDVFDEYSCILNRKDYDINLINLPIYPQTTYSYKQSYDLETQNQKDIIIPHGWKIFLPGNILVFIPECTSNGGVDTGAGWTPRDTLLTYPDRIANGWAVQKYEWKPSKTSVEPYEKYEIKTTWVRQTITTYDIAGQEQAPTTGTWELIGSVTKNGLPAHKYFNVGYPQILNDKPPNTSRIFGSSTVYFKYGIVSEAWEWSTVGDLITYNRCRKFNDVLNDIALDCGLSFKSDLFTNAKLFDNTKNKITNLMIAAKKDIAYPLGNPTYIANYNFTRLELWLKDMFNAYWYIENGVFIVEHISFFNKIVGKNLKTLDGGKYIKATNKYSYLENPFVNSEKWTFMEAISQDFVGVAIKYSYSNSNSSLSENTRDIPYMTTDLTAIQNVPGSVSEDGFVLMACDSDNFVIDAVGKLSQSLATNGHLSTANLQEIYFNHNMIYPSGIVNNASKIFASSVKVKKQSDIKFPLCCNDFDETKLVTTNLGDGEIDNAEYNLKDEMMTVDLAYPESSLYE